MSLAIVITQHIPKFTWCQNTRDRRRRQQNQSHKYLNIRYLLGHDNQKTYYLTKQLFYAWCINVLVWHRQPTYYKLYAVNLWMHFRLDTWQPQFSFFLLDLYQFRIRADPFNTFIIMFQILISMAWECENLFAHLLKSGMNYWKNV